MKHIVLPPLTFIVPDEKFTVTHFPLKVRSCFSLATFKMLVFRSLIRMYLGVGMSSPCLKINFSNV